MYKCTHEHTCDVCDRDEHVYAVEGVHVKMELVSYEPRFPNVYDLKHIGSKWSPNNLHFSSKYLYHFSIQEDKVEHAIGVQGEATLA